MTDRQTLPACWVVAMNATQRVASRADAFLHTVARSPHPAYPERTHVPDERVPFDHAWPEYSPVEFEHAAVTANDNTKNPKGWADPADIAAVSEDEWSRRREAGPINFGEDGKPQNPNGRTGMIGRGLLGKWGPNYAADPLVTRWHPDDQTRLQMVAIKRKDSGDWAIPGGMVDPGENVSVTVKREFAEEAGNVTDPSQLELFEKLTKELFASGR